MDFWELPTPSQDSVWNENDKGVDYKPARGPREDRVDYRGAEKGDLTELGCYLNKRHPFRGLSSSLLPWSRFKFHSESVCLIGMSRAYPSRKGGLQAVWLKVSPRFYLKGKRVPRSHIVVPLTKGHRTEKNTPVCIFATSACVLHK